ncbi:MAG: hypothetical protein QNJ16_13215 [Rhodobacter sp.]|nr:hypothetical protein [Rhodobacter sp.]
MASIKSYIARLARFSNDETGAVTVDWVVVTAGVVGLAIAIATVLGSESIEHSERMVTVMSSQGIKSY